MRRSLLTLGLGLLVLATGSAVGAEAPPNEGKVRDLAGHVGRPFLEVIRRFGQPSAVETVRLVAVDPGVQDTTGAQWIYKSPAGAQVIFLIGKDGRVLEVKVRGAEALRYQVEPEVPVPGEKP